jgi:uncharacterized protein (TIGR02246 family)
MILLPRRRGEMRARSLDDNHFDREETVKIRLLVAIAGLAISFAVPASAQTKETIDPQTKAQLDGLTEKFATALDSNDASQMASVFAKDAVYVTNKGPLHGQEEIQKYFADLFKAVHVSDHWASVDSASFQAVGPDKVWRNGEWCTTVQLPDGKSAAQEGFWSAVEVREGDTWKHLLLTVNLTPHPAK